MMIFYFLYAGIFITCLLGVQLYFKLNNAENLNKIIAIFLLTLGIHIVHIALFKDIIDGLAYVSMAAPISLLYGPYLFLCYMASEGHPINLRRRWIHFLPFILGCVFFFYFIAFSGFRYQYGMHYYYVLYSMVSGSFIFYTVFVLFKSSYSQSTTLHVKRLSFYSIILLLVLAVFILTLLFNSGDERAQLTSPVSNSIIFGIMFLGSLLGYNFFLTQFQLGYDIKKSSKGVLADITFKNRALEYVSKPNHTSSNNNAFNKEKLLTYLDKKTFLESSFTIEVMANELKISKPLINQLFKSHFNHNFIKSINSLRIKEACKELQNESFDMNIDELAMRCGFKSRASFYRYFSQDLNCSPMEYREKYMIN